MQSWWGAATSSWNGSLYWWSVGYHCLEVDQRAIATTFCRQLIGDMATVGKCACVWTYVYSWQSFVHTFSLGVVPAGLCPCIKYVVCVAMYIPVCYPVVLKYAGGLTTRGYSYINCSTSLVASSDSALFVNDCTFDIVLEDETEDYYTYASQKVDCYQQTDCEDGDIRLVDGYSRRHGVVEICMQGLWGGITIERQLPF